MSDLVRSYTPPYLLHRMVQQARHRVLTPASQRQTDHSHRTPLKKILRPGRHPRADCCACLYRQLLSPACYTHRMRNSPVVGPVSRHRLSLPASSGGPETTHKSFLLINPSRDVIRSVESGTHPNSSHSLRHGRRESQGAEKIFGQGLNTTSTTYAVTGSPPFGTPLDFSAGFPSGFTDPRSRAISDSFFGRYTGHTPFRICVSASFGRLRT